MKPIICLILSLIISVPVAQPASPQQALQVPAKSALLMDMSTGTVLYEQNAHEKLPPASVTKVMTLLLIMEAVDSGQLGWEDTVTTSATAAAKGGSQIYLKEGELMSVRDMVKSIAVSSANDCACAMAEHLCGSEEAFVQRMNQRARELGMEDTQFANCTGLDDSLEAGAHVTSAWDIALMSRQLMLFHPDIRQFTTIWMDTVRQGSFGLSNTNKLVRFYPGATGLKTGFTAAAGYCLSATAQRQELSLVAVVMGCESSAQRFQACKTLLDYGFANFDLVRPRLPDSTTVPVRLGTADTVRAVPGAPEALLVEKSQKSQVTTQVTLEESVTAPVSQGQRLGTMTVRCGEQILAQIPLTAGESVPRRTTAQIFLQLLRRLCMAADTAA